jgi:hypothetical protein
MGRWLASPRRPGAHQRYADTWPTAKARTQCQQMARRDILRRDDAIAALTTQVAANTSTEALRSAQNRRSLRCG